GCAARGAGPEWRSRALVALARSRRESMSVPSRSKTISWDMARQEAAGQEGRSSRLRACRFLSIGGKRRRRLPDGYADDGQSLFGGLVENQPGDAFDGRIAVEQKDRLPQFLQRGDERIVVPQQHLVIQLVIDPAFHEPLDVAEIAHHVAAVERPRAHFDLGDRVVAVRMLADAVVIEEPVPVAEVDALRNGIHDNEIICRRLCSSPADSTAQCSSPTKRRATPCSQSMSGSDSRG